MTDLRTSTLNKLARPVAADLSALPVVAEAPAIASPVSALGQIDLSDLGAGTRGFVMYGHDFGLGLQADQAGFSVASAGDVDGDGFDDILVGAPSAYLGNAGYGNNFPGVAYLINGKASGHSAIELND